MSVRSDCLYKDMAITDLQLEKGRKRQRIPHLLIVGGSWNDLRRPSVYQIWTDRPHTNAGSTSPKNASPQPSSSPIFHGAVMVKIYSAEPCNVR